MLPVPRSHDPLAADWVALLLIACAVVLAVVQRKAPRMWRVLAQGNFRLRLGKQLMREDIDLQDRNLLALVLVSMFVLGLFAWQAIAINGGGGNYLPLVGAVALVFVAQALVPGICAALLRTDAGAKEYVYTGTLINTLLGLVLLPITVLIAYQTDLRAPLALAGIVLAGIAVLYRWLRGLVVGMGEGVSPGYIFLYFCAAEIVPFLLALHAFRDH